MRGDDFFVEIASKPPFSRVHPGLGRFYKGYLAHEKVVEFGAQRVINTQFPPYPGPAFENMARQFLPRERGEKRLYSVTLAVTNRCMFHCWHCYNAGRSSREMTFSRLKALARELQDLGATMITLTGGEPLLRRDLPEICAAFDGRSCLNLNTTGWGLTLPLARRLRKSGLFGLGVSLDSDEEAEHDRLRGRRGAFRAALRALDIGRRAGLYPYVIAVARRELLVRRRFMGFLRFVRDAGAREVHLLQPCAAGRLAGRRDAVLDRAHLSRILDYQRDVARREDLPVLSTFLYLEWPKAFGCGAGLTHIYIDGSGELCPCNFVPLSFGNVTREPLPVLLKRMGRHFVRPRCECVGRTLTPHVPPGKLPADPKTSAALCRELLPRRHDVPAFFRLRDRGAESEAGRTELRAAYDRIHESYDDFWVVEAGKPVRRLVDRLRLRGDERAFEAGCGSGFASALLGRKLRRGGTLAAVDISAGMLQLARRRAREEGLTNIAFRRDDALKALGIFGELDLVFTTWVLGYIPLAPFFRAAARALARTGRLGLVVHRQDSPREAVEIFSEIVAREPSALRRRVVFDFPRDGRDLRERLRAAGLRPDALWEGGVDFVYDSPEGVLEHLLKSGAGTVFYDAIAPGRRAAFKRQFVEALRRRHPRARRFTVTHDYLACIARPRAK